MRTRDLRGAKPSVHLVHEDRTTANNAVIMGDSRCLPNMLNTYVIYYFLTTANLGDCERAPDLIFATNTAFDALANIAAVV